MARTSHTERHPRPQPGTLAGVRPAFRAIAATVVPEAAELDEAGWSRVEETIETALAARPAAVRRQLTILIRSLDLSPLPRYGRRFRGLDAARRIRILEAAQDSPLALVRRGFWGLRTLILLGYYARPEAGREIGYRAHPRGWEARAAAATSPDGEQ